ncbi:MAG TPA: GNAT family N-acetyltransferase [Candidatus Aquabacterium excrementipullorum]|nr:GNAT family N-acetyltransferase [Candidatus Aquabacterium excrementipullorum]
MEITRASPGDARPVAEIHVSAWQEAYKTIFSAEYLASLSVEKRHVWWQEVIASGTSDLLVARAEGSVHGWLNFGPSRDGDAPTNQAEVWAFYVAPAHWSMGAGRSLWLHAKQLMRQQGFASCSLWVLEQNVRAIKFYEAAGFVADACAPRMLAREGKQLREVRYVHPFGAC